MADGMRVRSDEIDTVCTECYRVVEKRALITCPSCGGRTMYVPAGEGKTSAKNIKARGRKNPIPD